MVEVFHLKSVLKVNSGTLPLGYKQRLALACAVLHQPPVLFLDEPTSGVDPIERREFWSHINGLVEKGVTVLVTTHFMEEAEYCDRIALIYRGQEIALGTPDELKERMRTRDAGMTDPTLEDAFIGLLKEFDQQHQEAAA
jgi:ABC-2 type transport system ATP-binding protein